MPARTGRSYSIPGRGTVVRSKSGKAKGYAGKGAAPAGTTKVRPKTAATAPTVTVSSTGDVSTSNFPSRAAATEAKQKARRARVRVRRVQTAATRQLRSSQARQKRPSSPPTPPPQRSYDPNPATAVIRSTPNPVAKPITYGGKPTAGEPTRRELNRAESAGKLRTNKKGFVVTPRIGKTAGELRRLRVKAKKSTAPLPSLTPAESRNARIVLRVGDKVRDTHKEELATVMTGLVEAPDFENPAGGDADSEGWRQERTSIYGTGPKGPRNVKASAKRFYHELRTDAGTSTAATPGLLAQAAQGSAFPERYDEERARAEKIVAAYERGGLKPADRRQLQKVREKAQRLGLQVGGVAKKLGPAPKKVVTRFKAAKVAMKEVEGLPYVWGGGHGSASSSPTGGGLDCSGAVGYVLNKIGAMKGSATSGAMGQYLKPGPGLLTVFYNEGHTFLRIGDEYWGTSVGDSGAGGLGPHDAPSSAYLSEYSVGHVAGMGRKQALQMGFKDLVNGGSGGASAGGFPGVTFSQGGTVATIDPDAAVTKGKAGFSKSPIKATPFEKAMRTARHLKRLGVDVKLPGEKVSPRSSTTDAGDAELSRLERKYGKASV